MSVVSHPTVAWRLIRFLAPAWRWVALAALLGFATVASAIGLFYASAWLIASAALRPSIAVLQVAIVGVRAFGIGRAVFRYLERLVSHEVTFRLLAGLRVWFYQSIEPLAPAGLLWRHSGDLLERAIADVEALQHFYVRAVAPPLVALLVAALTWFLLAPLDPVLALIALLGQVLAGPGVALLVHSLARPAAWRLAAVGGELSVALLDVVQGAPDLLAFGAAAEYEARVDALATEKSRLQAWLARVQGLQLACGVAVTAVTVAVTLWRAIPLVNAGTLPGVYLAVVALSVSAAFEAALQLPAAAQHWSVGLAAGARVLALAEAAPLLQIPQDPLPQTLPPAGALEDALLPAEGPRGASIRAENLYFRYGPGGPYVLEDISFTLHPGQMLAIVGPSGAGKSSLLHLLLRFWDPERGSVWLDGCDLLGMAPETARHAMAVVSQDTYLFAGSVRDNLLLARPSASQAEVEAACAAAGLHETIAALPAGYDTEIGEQGLRFSGGERQRVALARALLKDAPLLLLDEPTAHLDTQTEAGVLQTMARATAGRTTIVATHRLRGLERAHEILVIHEGAVAERGTQAELLRLDGRYRRMYRSQQALEALDGCSEREGNRAERG